MNHVKTDIYKSLKKNTLIVWLVVISSTLISAFSIWTARDAHIKADRFIYSISSDEKLIPLEQIAKKEVATIFKKGHIELFINNFYDYDQWNYEKKMERSLWLVDETGKELYYFYKDSGHFNKMIQSSSSQRVYDVKSKIDGNNNFVVTAVIEINKPNQAQPKQYILSAQGNLQAVSQNYPLNPYGYFITNFRETNKQEIDE